MSKRKQSDRKAGKQGGDKKKNKNNKQEEEEEEEWQSETESDEDEEEEKEEEEGDEGCTESEEEEEEEEEEETVEEADARRDDYAFESMQTRHLRHDYSDFDTFQQIQARRKDRFYQALKSEQNRLVGEKHIQDGHIESCLMRYDALRTAYNECREDVELTANASGGPGVSKAKQNKAIATLKRHRKNASTHGVDSLNVPNEETMLFKIWDRLSYGADPKQIPSCVNSQLLPIERAVDRGSMLAVIALIREGGGLQKLIPPGRDGDGDDGGDVEVKQSNENPSCLSVLERACQRGSEGRALVRYLVEQCTPPLSLQQYKRLEASHLQKQEEYLDMAHNIRYRRGYYNAQLPPRPHSFAHVIFNEDILSEQGLQDKADTDNGITASLQLPAQYWAVQATRRTTATLPPVPLPPPPPKKKPFVGSGKPATLPAALVKPDQSAFD